MSTIQNKEMTSPLQITPGLIPDGNSEFPVTLQDFEPPPAEPPPTSSGGTTSK